MITDFQKTVFLAAHYAAQKEIEEYVSDMNNSYCREETELQQRKRVLDKLEEFGFKRFLLKNEQGNVFLGPVMGGVSPTDEDGGWRLTNVYNVNEIQEYLNYCQDSTAPLEYMQELYESEGYDSGPGRPFNAGCYVTQKRNRIVVSTSGGLDI